MYPRKLLLLRGQARKKNVSSGSSSTTNRASLAKATGGAGRETTSHVIGTAASKQDVAPRIGKK